eukprot:gb/GEZN01004924.1/.p1 GENE.gb/GEZN01004924.1/~~gb/GEZN01004924.1/.p1  ORF type:complete len:268 (+),score=16.28 gb/GEZN01004924.1/:31-804(+)
MMARVGDRWTLSVRLLSGRNISIQLPVTPSTTIHDLKTALDAQESIPADHQRLVFSGRELSDTETLQALGVSNGDTLSLLLRKVDVGPVIAGQAAHPIQQGPQDPGVPDQAVAVIIDGGDHAGMDFHDIAEIVRMSRAVKLFAIIDSLLLVLFVFWDTPILSIAIFMPLCGYYGAHKFRRPYVWVYLVYIPLYMGYRAYMTFTQDRGSSTNILFIIAFLVEFYIANIVVRFDRLIRARSAQQLDELYSLLHPDGAPR